MSFRDPSTSLKPVPPRARVTETLTHLAFYMDSRNLNLGPHAYMAGTFTNMSQLSRPTYKCFVFFLPLKKMCACVLWWSRGACGCAMVRGQLWYQFSSSAFMWIPGNHKEVRLSSKHFNCWVSHLPMYKSWSTYFHFWEWSILFGPEKGCKVLPEKYTGHVVPKDEAPWQGGYTQVSSALFSTQLTYLPPSISIENELLQGVSHTYTGF